MKYGLLCLSVLATTMILIVQGQGPPKDHKEMHEWYCKIDADRMDTLFCEIWYHNMEKPEQFRCPKQEADEASVVDFDIHAKNMHETWCAITENSEKPPCLGWKKVMESPEGNARYGNLDRISKEEL